MEGIEKAGSVAKSIKEIGALLIVVLLVVFTFYGDSRYASADDLRAAESKITTLEEGLKEIKAALAESERKASEWRSQTTCILTGGTYSSLNKSCMRPKGMAPAGVKRP